MNRVRLILIAIFLLVASTAFCADAPTIANVTSGVVDDIRVPILVSGDTITARKMITDDNVIITAIYWYLPTTIGHKAAFQDKAGNELFEMYAVVANQGLLFSPVRIPAAGLYMDDLDSGAVYIYLENK